MAKSVPSSRQRRILHRYGQAARLLLKPRRILRMHLVSIKTQTAHRILDFLCPRRTFIRSRNPDIRYGALANRIFGILSLMHLLVVTADKAEISKLPAD